MSFKVPYQSYPGLPQSAGGLYIARNFSDVERLVNNEIFPDGTEEWPTWSPILWQSANVAANITAATFLRFGRRIEAHCILNVAAAGTSGVAIEVRGLPVAAAVANSIVGSFSYLDSGNTIYSNTTVGTTTTSVRFYVDGNGNPMGVNPTFAVASGDLLIMTVSYQAAE